MTNNDHRPDGMYDVCVVGDVIDKDLQSFQAALTEMSPPPEDSPSQP